MTCEVGRCCIVITHTHTQCSNLTVYRWADWCQQTDRLANPLVLSVAAAAGGGGDVGRRDLGWVISEEVTWLRTGSALYQCQWRVVNQLINDRQTDRQTDTVSPAIDSYILASIHGSVAGRSCLLRVHECLSVRLSVTCRCCIETSVLSKLVFPSTVLCFIHSATASGYLGSRNNRWYFSLELFGNSGFRQISVVVARRRRKCSQQLTDNRCLLISFSVQLCVPCSWRGAERRAGPSAETG